MSAAFTLKGKLALAPALRSRNFRLFWFAQLISTIGTSLQVVVEGWLVYQVTDSTLWLGLVGFIGLLPVVPVALLGGVLIDRLPRRKLILLTQSGLLLQTTLFALLIHSGDIQLWQIIVLYSLFGAILAVDHPARRAFLVDLVSPDELANAVALNASLFNVSNLIGFMASGFLLATIGAAGAMSLNAASYLAPILALVAIRVADTGHEQQRPRLSSALSAGITALWRQPAVLAVIGLMAAVGGLAWPIFGLMPAFAEEVMGTNTVGLGLLLAAGALGSVIGTAVVARLGRRQRGRSLLFACLLLPFMVMGVALSRNMLLAGLLMVMVGLMLIIVQSLAVTLVHLSISDQVRGRVMSLYSMVHAGSDTVANVMIGGLALNLGLPLALCLGGVLALFITGVLWLTMPAVRRLE
jgi:MFS family permease